MLSILQPKFVSAWRHKSASYLCKKQVFENCHWRTFASHGTNYLMYLFEFKSNVCISRIPIFDIKNSAKFFKHYSIIAITQQKIKKH